MPPSLNSKADFMRRLGYYAIGIAIGFLLLGMFQQLRAREFAARQAPSGQTPGVHPGPVSSPAESGADPSNAAPESSSGTASDRAMDTGG